MCMFVCPYVVQMILNILLDIYMNIGVCYRQHSSQIHENTETFSLGLR